jgi:hypothetical protein
MKTLLGTTAVIVMVPTMFVAGSPLAGADPAPSPATKPVALCQALGAIRAGEATSIVVSGIYEVALEAAGFYDPDQHICPLNVQPITSVAFIGHAERHPDLEALLERSGRAYVTFKGRLFGPPTVKPDDLTRSAAASMAIRLSGPHRYGANNRFRTQLVVDEVVAVSPVPDVVPWFWGGKPHYSIPLVEAAALPHYPEVARNLGVTGDVVVAVTVRNGKVIAAEPESGDRLFWDETVRNIRSWRFASSDNTRFTTRFVYRLEQRPANQGANARVEMELPLVVTITAPTNDW